MKDRDQVPAVTGMDLLGMHRLASENGDGFTSAFMEVMIRAQLDAAGPRLVVSNDEHQRSDRPSQKNTDGSVPLVLVGKPATAG